ncbi:MAG: hypothetical protein JNK82_16785, partial [Myxococcaceae bacterium]|nr:hypothetical protein [Myxococcaceae bacterium]
ATEENRAYETLPVGGFSTVAVNAVVPLAFDFYFFGTKLDAVTFTQFGYLQPSTVTTAATGSNQTVPHNAMAAPPAFIAAWWDNWCTNCVGLQLRHGVRRTAPNREMVFEWFGMRMASTQQAVNFQVILTEGTNEIGFAYSGAQINLSGSNGVQKETNVGVPGQGCSTVMATFCGTWPSSKLIRMQVPPDLTIANLSLDPIGYSGVRYNATAQVANLGGREGANTVVRYFLSTDTMYGGDWEIGSTAATTFPGATTTTVNTLPNALMPADAGPGNYYVISVVDPGNVVNESNESNNFYAPQAITIGSPLPDLVVESVAVMGAQTAMPGGTISVARSIANRGNAPAANVKYQWFVSQNSVVSISDTPLGAAQTIADLQPNVPNNTPPDTLTLPANLPAGLYWVGLCANYDPAGTPMFPITEISQVNNCNQVAVGSPITVSSGQLAIITPAALPDAVQHSPYGIRLVAAGGNGSYGWALAPGAVLPPGLSFTPAGDLIGTPSVAMAYSFAATVTSGGVMQMQTFSLTVAPGNIPLSIVDQDLPAAEFGRAYEGAFIAVGGKPPYVWQLTGSSRLPQGLAVSYEGGVEGRANEAGDFNFGIEVTDSAGTKVEKNLRIRVVMPTSMHIATSRLRTAYLRQDYEQQLVAVGGRPPDTGAILKFQQLPQNPTERPGDAGTAIDPDLGIYLDEGNVDFLRGEPKKAGLYVITLKVTDNGSAEDFTTLLLNVSYTEPLAIQTTALPDAFQGRDYEVRVRHNRENESMGIKFSVPCVLQARNTTQFECAPVEETQKLPPGLTLNDDGTITGATTDTGADDKVYTFLVKVVDDANRQDIRSLSIRVRPNPVASGGGCSSTAAVAPLLLAALLLAFRRLALAGSRIKRSAP